MDETYYVGAYWASRKESAESCASRVERFLGALSRCDPSFAQWFRQGRTRQAALKHPFPTDVESVTAFFLRQSQKAGRLATQGWSADVWNGQSADEDSSALSLCCGATSPRLPNFCLLEPPLEGPTAERLLRPPLLTQILRALVLAWNPEWGVATSHAFRDRLTDSAEAGTFVGPLTYFSRRRGVLPPLPPAVQLEPVEDLGTLVLLTPEPVSSSNPHHLDLAREVSERLSRAGLLSPLRPEAP